MTDYGIDQEAALAMLASKLKQHEASVSDILGVIILLPSLLPVIRKKTHYLDKEE